MSAQGHGQSSAGACPARPRTPVLRIRRKWRAQPAWKRWFSCSSSVFFFCMCRAPRQLEYGMGTPRVNLSSRSSDHTHFSEIHGNRFASGRCDYLRTRPFLKSVGKMGKAVRIRTNFLSQRSLVLGVLWNGRSSSPVLCTVAVVCGAATGSQPASVRPMAGFYSGRLRIWAMGMSRIPKDLEDQARRIDGERRVERVRGQIVRWSSEGARHNPGSRTPQPNTVAAAL